MECAHIICAHTYVCVWFVHGLSITALCSFFSIYIFYQMYVPQFMYMFSYWWIFGLFPHIGSYKWCCCEHSSTYLLSIHMHTILLYMPRVEVLDQRVWIYPVLMYNNKILYPLVQIFLPHNCGSLPCLPLLSSSSFFSSCFSSSFK